MYHEILQTNPVKWEENVPANRITELTAKDYDSDENGPPFSYSIGANAEPDIKTSFEIRGEFPSVCIGQQGEAQEEVKC